MKSLATHQQLNMKFEEERERYDTGKIKKDKRERERDGQRKHDGEGVISELSERDGGSDVISAKE